MAAAVLLQQAMAQGQGQLPRELRRGLSYVEGLQERGFIDIAEKVLAELSAQYPEAKTQAAALKLRGMLAVGKFDEVRAIIAKLPDKTTPEAWAMKLTLADGYYAYARNEEATALYKEFLGQYATKTPPESLVSFFTQSAYKFAQMQLNNKDRVGALETYQLLNKYGKVLPKMIRRQCLAETGDVALTIAEETDSAAKKKEMCELAEKMADSLLWEQDLWFGKGIVIKAHSLMIQHKPDAAKKLVNDYMPTLSEIHSALVQQEKDTGEQYSRVSPMPECRYLLATMLKAEADKLMADPKFNPKDPKQREAVLSLFLGSKNANGKRAGDGAYNHFVNVYIKYPESSWAPDAGNAADEIEAILVDTFHGNIKKQVTDEQTANVRKIQVRDARTLYAQNQFDNAKERLSQVLNQFNPSVEMIPAVGDLARCYIQESNEGDDPERRAESMLYGQTIASYLASRYSGDKSFIVPAGDELIRIAEFWEANGQPGERIATYDLFFRNFPTHPSAPGFLFNFGEKAFQEKNFGVAVDYFNRVANTYTNSPRRFDSLSRITTIYSEAKDYTNLVVAANRYVKALEAQKNPPQALMNARFTLCQAYRDQGLSLVRGEAPTKEDVALGNKYLARAVVSYTNLVALLANPPPSTQVNEEEAGRNKSLRAASLYNAGGAYSQMSGLSDNALALARQRAIALYEQLIKEYPGSDMAPAALIQVGSIWSMLKNVEKAEAALTKLRTDYPNSTQAKSALPLLADNLMKLGMREEAVKRYREMFTSSDAKYSDYDILRACEVLTESREYELARQGIDLVLGRAKDEWAIVKAKYADANLTLLSGDSKGAVEKFKAFIKDHPSVMLVVDANLQLSRAASEAGEKEKDDEPRRLLFNDAVDAMKFVRTRRTNELEQAQADIDVGRIMTRKAKAEVAFGKADAAAKTRGKAVISYQLFIDSIKAGDNRFNEPLEIAYHEIIPLLIEDGNWDLVAENAESALRLFPNGRFKSEFDAWRNQARIEGGNAGGAQ